MYFTDMTYICSKWKFVSEYDTPVYNLFYSLADSQFLNFVSKKQFLSSTISNVMLLVFVFEREFNMRDQTNKFLFSMY